MNKKIIVTTLVLMSVFVGGCINQQAKQVPKENVTKPSIQDNQNEQTFFEKWVSKKGNGCNFYIKDTIYECLFYIITKYYLCLK